MSDLSFSSLISAIFQFLTDVHSVPNWILLILIATSIPQFIKIYRWIRRSDQVEQLANRTYSPAKKAPGTSSSHGFTDSVITTVNKLKDVAQTATEVASGGIAAAAKKFEAETSQPPPKKSVEQKGGEDVEQAKKIILQKLFTVGDNGRLPQSIASDLGMSAIVTNNYLKELTETNLVAKRKTTLGETYFITKLGKAFCEKEGFEK